MKYDELLALAATGFDAVKTSDRGIEYQQDLATLPVAVPIVLVNSNRLKDISEKLQFEPAPYSAPPDLTDVKNSNQTTHSARGDAAGFWW